MPKNILIVVVLVSLALSVRTPVHAVFIQVNPQGDVNVYQNRVLGDDDTQDDSDEDDDSTDDSKDDEREQEKEVKKVDEKPIKSVPSEQKASEKVEVRLKTVNKDETKMELLKKSTNSTRTVEKKDEKRVEMEFADKEAELRKLRLENEQELKAFQLNLNSSNAANKEELLKRKQAELSKEVAAKEQELRMIESGEELEIKQNEDSLEENKPLVSLSPRPGQASLTEEERAKRQALRKEKVMQLRDAVKNNSREMELEGEGGVKARFAQGAELVVDSDLGTVKLVTPSGEEKELNNFPDEVIEKLKLQEQLNTDGATEIEVEVGANGEIKHKIKNITKQKRLFGIIPREVKVEAEVDDATGDVSISETEQSPLDQVLNVFSL